MSALTYLRDNIWNAVNSVGVLVGCLLAAGSLYISYKQTWEPEISVKGFVESVNIDYSIRREHNQDIVVAESQVQIILKNLLSKPIFISGVNPVVVTSVNGIPNSDALWPVKIEPNDIMKAKATGIYKAEGKAALSILGMAALDKTDDVEAILDKYNIDIFGRELPGIWSQGGYCSETKKSPPEGVIFDATIYTDDYDVIYCYVVLYVGGEF